MAKFKVNGLKKLLRDIDKIERNIDIETQLELKKVADGILSDALSRIPVDKGQLKASAFVEAIDGGWTVGFSAKYAPYQEFGAGPFTEVPNGYEDYAMEFYIDGTGTTRPQPFLFPAFLSKRDSIVDDISDALNVYINKF